MYIPKSYLIALLVALLLGCIGVVWYTKNSSKPAAPAPTEKVLVRLQESAVYAVVDDEQAKILAKGDINKDEYEDAVVQEVVCGASCSILPLVVLGKADGSVERIDATFPKVIPWGAAKTDVLEISITSGSISIMARGFEDVPSWDTVSTKHYKFEDGSFVEIEL